MAKTVKKRKPPAVKKSTKTSARAARPGVKKPTKGNLPSFHHAELDNGLQIIAECHPHMHSAAGTGRRESLLGAHDFQRNRAPFGR